MKRFQTMMNTLPLMVILTIALCSVAQILLPNRQQANSASNPGSTVSTLPPMPNFDAQQSKTYQLVAGSVHDGDTLRVTDGGEEIKIRLCGIDAPEIDQPLGIASRDHLRSLMNRGNGAINVVSVETDQYGRTVAELFVPTGNGEEIPINAQMVQDGYAYHYARYSGGCPNGAVLAGAEQEAQSARRGVWANPNAVKPWDYRRENR